MDTLDAKTRIMNEIDSIDVQAQALQEKLAELHSRKNQFKEAYTSIIAAEQQAENLLSGLLKAADPDEVGPEPEEEIWDAPVETEDQERPRFVPVLEEEISAASEDEETAQGLPVSEEAPDSRAVAAGNGREKGPRPVPSFLRQYL